MKLAKRPGRGIRACRAGSKERTNMPAHRSQRIGCILFVALAGVSAEAADLARTNVGSFEIETRAATISAGGFPNISANPFARKSVTVFAVRHRGKLVAVADGKEKIAEFWEAKALDGAPRPAVLVA